MAGGVSARGGCLTLGARLRVETDIAFWSHGNSYLPVHCVWHRQGFHDIFLPINQDGRLKDFFLSEI